MNKLVGMLAGGVIATGSFFIGYKIAEKKWQKKADEEIASVKKTLEEHYKRTENNKKLKNKNDINHTKEVTVEKPVKSSKKDIAKSKYVDYAAMYKNDNISEQAVPKIDVNTQSITNIGQIHPVDIPDSTDSHDSELISEDEFAESDYDTETYYLYSDGVLADWTNKTISMASILGTDMPEEINRHMNEGVLYVRNNLSRIDYEIIVDERKYSDCITHKKA